MNERMNQSIEQDTKKGLRYRVSKGKDANETGRATMEKCYRQTMANAVCQSLLWRNEKKNDSSYLSFGSIHLHSCLDFCPRNTGFLFSPFWFI